MLLACIVHAKDSGNSVPNEEYCDAGEIISDDNGQKLCCRGYRDDGENWIGHINIKCCPLGTSVNGRGLCIACGAGNHYNMLYADIQHHQLGTEACGKRCTQNQDCSANQFCYMDAYVTQANTNIDPVVGTCVTAENVGGIIEKNIVVEGIPSGHWIGPKKMLDWWSARNFCARFGNVDLPTRRQICGHITEPGNSCPSPLRRELEKQMGAHQQASHFWLEETGDGKAYYVDPAAWGYVVKIPPEVTARARSAGVVCGPTSN